MIFTLTEYQADVVRSVLTRYRNARSLWSDDRGLTAVGLTAPTGAGKTVIASAVLEKLFKGTDSTSPNPDLTVLWLTDDPSLNEQSKAKIKLASGSFTDAQLITLDAGYDEPELPVGAICFLNIQRLGTGASSHTSTGDHRQHSLWSILANTVRNRPNDFLLVVDEAHRGASVKAGEKKTIMRTVMDGGQVSFKDAAGGTQTVTLPPAPIVLGISATPEKFESAVDSSSRTLMKVAADTNKVRESGMVKDLINLAYSADDQTTDDTLLRLGTRDLVASEKLWAQEAAAAGRAEPIKPIMVVQVADRTTDKALADIVDSIMEEWPRQKNSDGTDGDHLPITFAHSFGEHTDIDLKDERETRIRYIAPQDIQGHRDVRVVFFKTALTTGWDCPRAEVMVSMRAAKEYTSIAQLMGRMVRTPLASRVHSPGLEELNSVTLYLPHYDASQVAKVVESFSGDADISIDVAINPVEFQRADGIHPDVWNKTLIKQLKPVRKHNSESARLAALATILDTLKVPNPAGEAKFEETVREHLIGTMMSVYKTAKAEIEAKADGYMSVDFETVSVDSLTGETGASTTKTLTVSTKNLRQLKDAAIRKLPDATGKWLYVHLLDYLNGDEAEASALTAAISFHEPTLSTLEASAAALINTLRQQLSPALDGLAAEDRKLIKDALQSPTDPTPDGFKLPAVEKARTQKLDKATKEIVDLPRFNGHLFADDEGFPMVATSWEAAVIDRIRHRIDGFQGWYRNPSSAKGLSIAYQDNGTWKLLYPDFLAYYHSAAGLRVDIIDPHNHSLSDTSAKWSALARYARACEKVGDGLYGQVLAVIKRGDTMWSLELGGPSSVEVEKALATASSASEIEAVFEKHGGVL